MLSQIGKALLQGFDIFFLQVLLVYAAVHFKSPDCCDDDDGVRFNAGETALNVHEFFRAEVCAETGFRNGDLAHLEGQLRSDDRVAAMRDVGEGAAVYEGRRVLDRLDEVRLDSVLHEDSHCAFDAELAGRHEVAVQVISYGDVAHALLQVHEVAGQAQGRHDFRGDGNHEVVFPRESADLASHADDDVAQGPVVHVHDALPDDAAHVDAQGVALMNVVINGSGQKIVGRRNSVHIACKMEINIFHRQYLRIAAAGSTALNAEYGSKGRFAQGDDGLMTHVVQRLGEADRRQRLAFAGRRRRNSRDEDELAVFVFRKTLDSVKGNLCLIFTV